AYHGKQVVIYDLNDDALAKLDDRWAHLAPMYLRDLPDATEDRLAAAVQRLATTSDLATALTDADLVIEAVPEILEIKREVWAKVGQIAPAQTIFATNSSTLLPSYIAEASGRPEQFLAMHFANDIWRFNTVEIMGHAGTVTQAIDAAVA